MVRWVRGDAGSSVNSPPLETSWAANPARYWLTSSPRETARCFTCSNRALSMLSRNWTLFTARGVRDLPFIVVICRALWARLPEIATKKIDYDLERPRTRSNEKAVQSPRLQMAQMELPS